MLLIANQGSYHWCNSLEGYRPGALYLTAGVTLSIPKRRVCFYGECRARGNVQTSLIVLISHTCSLNVSHQHSPWRIRVAVSLAFSIQYHGYPLFNELLNLEGQFCPQNVF
ncbi:hypothetical protein NDU88_001364 [Pleurodeles waltl]|uniref:Uncharacterized protein n=1 Tax=Pleurodeles waltl TaxID=8319 RepID=A0AAV7WKA0_PLEWA|nr:hypothetical protein NDU88_001364 [Pleurodeles waltl]